MRHLFSCWDKILPQIKAAEKVMLLLDYDGTLVPIAPSPDMAQLPPQTREVLKQISQCAAFEMAIISGRSLSAIKALVGLKNIAYAGNHGLEIEYPRGKFTPPADANFRPLLETVEQRIKEKLAGVEGVFIEDKGLTLSVHYRLVQEPMAKEVKNLILKAARSCMKEGNFKLTRGKKVIEIRPPLEWDKGKAIEWLLEIYGRPGNLPIFAGDDATDEDGFKVVQGLGGISIFVGEESFPVSADYYVHSPSELCSWLANLFRFCDL